MEKFLRNPKISGIRVRFESGYPKIFGFSDRVQVGKVLPVPDPKPVFFRVPLYGNVQIRKTDKYSYIRSNSNIFNQCTMVYHLLRDQKWIR
jgi:hypothetical protein